VDVQSSASTTRRLTSSGPTPRHSFSKTCLHAYHHTMPSCSSPYLNTYNSYNQIASRMLLANPSIAANPADSSPLSPSALTNALPTITPSAPHALICLACSGPLTPKPTAILLSVFSLKVSINPYA
jgi:hypothetical protein